MTMTKTPTPIIRAVRALDEAIARMCPQPGRVAEIRNELLAGKTSPVHLARQLQTLVDCYPAESDARKAGEAHVLEAIEALTSMMEAARMQHIVGIKSAPAQGG